MGPAPHGEALQILLSAGLLSCAAVQCPLLWGASTTCRCHRSRSSAPACAVVRHCFLDRRDCGHRGYMYRDCLAGARWLR